MTNYDEWREEDVEDKDDELMDDEDEKDDEESLTELVARLIGESGGAAVSYEDNDVAEIIAEVIEDSSIVEIRVERDADCPNCEQRTRLAGRVTVFDHFGNDSGSYNHQHGCGAWNEPAANFIRSRDEDEIRALIQHVINENDKQVAAERARWEREDALVRAYEQGGELAEMTPNELRQLTINEDSPLRNVLDNFTQLYHTRTFADAKTDTQAVLAALAGGMTSATTGTEAQQIVDNAVEAHALVEEALRAGHPVPWAAKMARNKTGIVLPEALVDEIAGRMKAETEQVSA
ncbi:MULTISPECIES: hypothetical protein [Mycobacteroides]|uniref:hypothetical protein n=1 Tax=Mycobacteroides TaxID=670516 RepID=UPI0009268733|nr:hypothetical protein [Mycobacteroides abscessus]MDO3102684.1 hypothetical protein [Mycobacteroides abscessus subsp. abscessus]SIN55709.1 Uncharacterised protein [Mycobacteroides abscessus subsp. abscessus]